jgi:polyhydroxyalkanoic acid synthase PhaR subunit
MRGRETKGAPAVADDTQTRSPLGPLDPMELWKRWLDVSLSAWSGMANAAGGGRPPLPDTWSPFLLWMRGPMGTRPAAARPGGPSATAESAGAAPASPRVPDPREIWRQWFDVTTGFLQRSAEAGGDPLNLTARWLELLEEVQHRLLATDPFPADPIALFRQWYDATSETWARAAGEAFGAKLFAENTGRFMEQYAGYFATLRQTSEEYFRQLQIPTRSDIARVAGLVVALEEKVDRVEEALEAGAESARAPGAPDGRALDERIARVEQRLDQLLSAVERLASQGAPRATGRSRARSDERPQERDAPARRSRAPRGGDGATGGENGAPRRAARNARPPA